MKTQCAVTAVTLCLIGLAPTVAAQPLGVAIGTSAPPATLGIFDMVPFAPDLSPLNATTSAVALPVGATPVGSVGFDTPLFHYKVGSGWAGWSNSYVGDVYLFDVGADPLYLPPLPGEPAGPAPTLTLSLPAATKAFYFYVEPNLLAGSTDFNITAATSDGGGFSFSGQSITGAGGAKGFGFYVANAGAPSLTSIAIVGPDTWPAGFGVGQFAINGTAGPGVPDNGATATMLAAALVALAAFARRRAV